MTTTEQVELKAKELYLIFNFTDNERLWKLCPLDTKERWRLISMSVLAAEIKARINEAEIQYGRINNSRIPILESQLEELESL